MTLDEYFRFTKDKNLADRHQKDEIIDIQITEGEQKVSKFIEKTGKDSVMNTGISEDSQHLKQRPKTKNISRNAQKLIKIHRMKHHSRNAARILQTVENAKTHTNNYQNFFRTNLFSTLGNNDNNQRCQTPMTVYVSI